MSIPISQTVTTMTTNIPITMSILGFTFYLTFQLFQCDLKAVVGQLKSALFTKGFIPLFPQLE